MSCENVLPIAVACRRSSSSARCGASSCITLEFWEGFFSTDLGCVVVLDGEEVKAPFGRCVVCSIQLSHKAITSANCMGPADVSEVL